VTDQVHVRLNGRDVMVPASGTLLDALRGSLQATEVKDGCAPQGQCGACTVLVNGAPRVSCVTPVSRVANADITTVAGLPADVLDRYVDAFETTGAAQCGFCTPGIVCRLVGTDDRRGTSTESVHKALAAHVCRCTGWQPIVEAALLAHEGVLAPRDTEAAQARATLENGTPQMAGREVVLGAAPFASDRRREVAAVAWTNGDVPYTLGDDVGSIRRAVGAVQGRHSTLAVSWPVALPEGDWDVTVQTTFVEPAAVEPDAVVAWPNGEATMAAGNAGAFGAKRTSALRDDALAVARDTDAPVLAVWSREAVVRLGKKRPPLVIALRADGSGVVRVGVTPNSDDLTPLIEMVQQMHPTLEVATVSIAGPPVGSSHRVAVLGEVLAARAMQGRTSGDRCTVTSPSGAVATAWFADGNLHIDVDAGDPLCPVTLRSYVMGAAHQAYSMVTSEGLVIDADGSPQSLTMRSFGIVPAAAMPFMNVTHTASKEPAKPVGGAVFAAVLAATALHVGATRWPHRAAGRA
jgi:aerobic-type carbon monoxide dehydrogenase small subunit (CoxS/CutS family)